jgi:HTH-type transcriptional regulator/antitoxin HigA
MSTCMKCGDKVALHPGYYLKEVMDESGLTQEEFAKRLNIGSDDFTKLLNGEERLSAEMAVKLSHMFE